MKVKNIINLKKLNIKNVDIEGDFGIYGMDWREDGFVRFFIDENYSCTIIKKMSCQEAVNIAKELGFENLLITEKPGHANNVLKFIPIEKEDSLTTRWRGR